MIEEVALQEIVIDDEPVLCREERWEVGKSKSTGTCMKMAGWGTDHLGEGACKDHEVKEISLRDENVYVLDVRHKRLNELVASENARSELGGLDNLDNEIVLLRAMIRMSAEKFGFDLIPDGDDGLIVGEVEDPSAIRQHIATITHFIDRLSQLIKRKYEILHISGETISRERVRSYVTNIQIILNDELRDSCSECGHKHNMRKKALDKMFVLGDL
tara:strand:- start:14640 stop:15287 length:648 start_codon:yes stop_codon:yes gene_type:complete